MLGKWPMWLWWVATSIALYALFCGLLWWGQTRLIFVPQAQMEEMPRDRGIDYEVVWLRVEGAPEGERLHSWWLPAGEPDRQEGAIADTTILYLHGNSGNLSANIALLEGWHRLGVNVFALDYRGYGRSPGRFPNEWRVYEDAEAAWRYLTETRGIPPQQIIVHGHSLGGAIAIELATRHPQMAGLVIEGSFTSMKEVAAAGGWSRLVPLDWVLHQRFDSIAKLSNLSLPMLFVRGTADEIVPPEMSERLHRAAVGKKAFHSVEGGGHEDFAVVGGEAERRMLRQFIQACRALSPSP